MASSETCNALDTESNAENNETEETSSIGPGIIMFNRKFRFMTTLKKFLEIILVGSGDPSDAGHSQRAKQLSSIEMDPDEEKTDASSSSTNRISSKNGLRKCLTTKGYAFMVTCIEFIVLLYLISTATVIYTKDVIYAWYFQPFIAPLWFRDAKMVFSITCFLCTMGFFGVICLMQALDDRKRSAKLMIPHLILQMLTIFFTFICSLVSVVLLLISGTFSLRIVELATTALGNGLIGIGSIVLGLEHGGMESRASENVLISVGITPLSMRVHDLHQQNSSDALISSTLASSIVHYNMIGAIWDAFSYEIALVVALIVFGTTCAMEIFFWLLIRQLYAKRLTQGKRVKKQSSEQNGHHRRRYNSTGNTVV